MEIGGNVSRHFLFRGMVCKRYLHFLFVGGGGPASRDLLFWVWKECVSHNFLLAGGWGRPRRNFLFGGSLSPNALFCGSIRLTLLFRGGLGEC